MNGQSAYQQDRAKAVFVKCDTKSWEDQVRLFDIAISMSPHKSVDMVIANAGVGRGSGDPLMPLEGAVFTSLNLRLALRE
jgi:NAD(P)-dependent dehydrogenase (short-subunit alcohol dehydrogenase family)